MGIIVINSDGIPIRSTLENSVTVQYAGLITQLVTKARSSIRELDPQVAASAVVQGPDAAAE